MSSLRTQDPATDVAPLPWFQRRPGLTLGVAVALFVVVFVVRISEGDDIGSAVNMLYVLPVALVAVTFGFRAGLAAGLVGVALVAIWAQTTGVELSFMGWTSRILPLLLLGTLLGRASDMLRRAEAARHRLEAAALRHREAIEINDSLIQGMAAAKWSLEMGRVDAGLKTLDHTLELGHELVSVLIREAGMGLDGHRPPSPPRAQEERNDPDEESAAG